jgi:hypothetical protein
MECIVCLDAKEQDQFITFSCTHSICLLCYERLLFNQEVKCPLCRHRIESHMIPIDIEDNQEPTQPNEISIYKRLCILLTTTTTISLIFFFIIRKS